VDTSSDENNESGTQHVEALTNRERQLLQILARGVNNEAIANLLNISIKTVEFHVSNILRKLKMKSRTEVIAWLFRQQQPNIPQATKNQGSL
jgi:DNA-binding NarL/FixJ family response regulator